MQPIFLTHKLDAESAIKGEISGIAYSGGVIPEHGFLTNLVVDISSLSIAKEKTPLFRDHNPSLVAGHGKVTIDGNKVLITGNLSKKTPHGLEIMDLSSEGFEWEMSLGLYNGRIEEVRDAEVNGIQVEYANVLRDALLREVSIVALGADKDTSAQILSQKKGEPETMKLTAEQYVSLACACGGNKDTTPEELEKMAKDQKLMTEEQEAKISELETEIEALKSEIEAKQSEIDAIKATEEEEAREEQIESAVKAKNIKFSQEKIKAAAKTKEATEMLLSIVEDMPAQGKIDAKLTGKQDLSKTTAAKADDTNSVILAAKQMVKDGLAKDLVEAISKLEVK